MGGEKGVDLREGAAAEKAAVGAEGAGVRRFEHETRMGRGLARGGQDEGCEVCSDANPPLLVSFSPPAAFSFDIKGKGG